MTRAPAKLSGRKAPTGWPAGPASDRPADLVLASASPRRRELLERIGLRLLIRPVDIDETARANEDPRSYVERIAIEKADAAGRLAAASPEIAALAVLSADTTVVLGRRILGKPADPREAADMLRAMAGRRHEVMTAYRIRRRSHDAGRVVITEVSMRSIDDAEIAAYVDSGEWRGKAGGYAVQGIAALFVTGVRGSITNVIGLPLAEVIADLRTAKALPKYPPRGFGGPETRDPE